MVVFKFRNLKTGQAMPVPPGEFLIGRTRDAYVHVDDSSVSRSHARLFNSEEGFFIEDLGSANGTALNGALITARTRIDFGQILYVGSVPFRIDPEVSGQVEEHPAPSAHRANPASLNRATERIPAVGEAAWVPQAVPPDQLAAPAVNPNDSEAETLNAITLRDPEPAAPAISPKPDAGEKTFASPATRARSSVSGPTIVPRLAAPQHQARQQALLEAEMRESALRQMVPQPAPESPYQARSGAVNSPWSWIWYLVVFFAGMGGGLLLGLVFAKVFFEMGGKAALLPG